MGSPWYDRGYRVGKRARWTVVLSVIAFFIGAGATFYWHREVFAFLLAPAGELLSPFDGLPVYNAVPDMFGATLNLSIAGGKLASFPVLVVGFLSLIKPLTPFVWWWRFLAINTVIAFVLSAIGVVFVYFVMMPVSLNFLLSFGTDIAEPLITLDSYTELLFSLFRWIAFIFLLPLIMNILARLRVLSYPRAKGVWRIGIFLVLFFSAIISPGLDGFITIIVAGTMYSLYLVGLGAVWIVNPSEGNYLFLRTIGRGVRKVLNNVLVWIELGIRKASDAGVWIERRPAVMIRWLVDIYVYPFCLP